jgi:hypothetical protein
MEENTKTDLKEILAVSGYSPLFSFVNRSKNGVIVENINDKKRTMIGESARVSTLADISIYTDSEEMPLRTVLEKIKEKESGNEVNIDAKKAAPEILKKYFEELIPDYDKDRFYVSHMRKIIDWYNQLQRNAMLDFASEENAESESEGEENSDKENKE